MANKLLPIGGHSLSGLDITVANEIMYEDGTLTMAPTMRIAPHASRDRLLMRVRKSYFDVTWKSEVPYESIPLWGHVGSIMLGSARVYYFGDTPQIPRSLFRLQPGSHTQDKQIILSMRRARQVPAKFSTMSVRGTAGTSSAELEWSSDMLYGYAVNGFESPIEIKPPIFRFTSHDNAGFTEFDGMQDFMHYTSGEKIAHGDIEHLDLLHEVGPELYESELALRALQNGFGSR